MNLFTLTQGQSELRNKVSELLDYTTANIQQSNLEKKELYSVITQAAG